MKRRIDFDKIWFGLLLGLAAPLIIYWLYFVFADKYLLKRINVSLCMVINLIPFYLTLNVGNYKATKGVVIATFIYAGIIAYFSFFTDYLHIL